MQKIVALDVTPDSTVVFVKLSALPDFAKPPKGLSHPVRIPSRRSHDDFRARYGMPRGIAPA